MQTLTQFVLVLQDYERSDAAIIAAADAKAPQGSHRGADPAGHLRPAQPEAGGGPQLRTRADQSEKRQEAQTQATPLAGVAERRAAGGQACGQNPHGEVTAAQPGDGHEQQPLEAADGRQNCQSSDSATGRLVEKDAQKSGRQQTGAVQKGVGFSVWQLRPLLRLQTVERLGGREAEMHHAEHGRGERRARHRRQFGPVHDGPGSVWGQIRGRLGDRSSSRQTSAREQKTFCFGAELQRAGARC